MQNGQGHIPGGADGDGALGGKHVAGLAEGGQQMVAQQCGEPLGRQQLPGEPGRISGHGLYLVAGEEHADDAKIRALYCNGPSTVEHGHVTNLQALRAGGPKRDSGPSHQEIDGNIIDAVTSTALHAALRLD